MRLLQLITGEDELLDLHPNVTVVRGLDERRREMLASTVRGLADGRGPNAAGLLEAHGVLFDLDSPLVGLLDLEQVGVDPVVRAGDLPTQPLTVDEQELRGREVAFAELLGRISTQVERQAQARIAVAECVSALDAARAARARAESGAVDRSADLQEHAAQLATLVAETERLHAELERLTDEDASASAARADIEAHAAERRRTAAEAQGAHEALATELEALESARAAAVGPAGGRAAGPEREAPTDPAPPSTNGLDESTADRLRTIDQLLMMLKPADVRGVQGALALLRGDGPDVELVPSMEAAELADELEQLDGWIAEDLGDGPASEAAAPDLAAARRQLEEAQAAALEAEQAVRSPALDPADVVELERAHDALLDAVERGERRLGGARARSRLDALRAAEQAVLDRMGFTSYPDYVMGNPRRGLEPVLQTALHAAREALASAEIAWAEAEAAAADALEIAERRDRRRTVLERARALLGDGAGAEGDLVRQLRELRVPSVSAEAAAIHLRDALSAAGLDVGDEHLDHLDLELFADAWLAEAADVDDRRRLLLEERQGLGAVPDDLPGPDGPAQPAGAPDGHRSAVDDTLAAAARAVADEDALEVRWAELAARVEDAEAVARAATEEAARAEADLERAIDQQARSRERWEAVATELERAEQAEAEARSAIDAMATEGPIDLDALNAAIDAAEGAHREAVTALDVEGRALAALDAEGQAAAIEIERLQDIVVAQGNGGATPAEELEWYLLARLASQRAVSVAGSIPLLLDDALRGLMSSDVDRILDRLERMAETVQVIVVSEDPLVATWAEAAGPSRAAVVELSAP